MESINLISSEDLLKELYNRNDIAVICLMKKDTDNIYSGIQDFKGNLFTILGTLEHLKVKVMEQIQQGAINEQE